MYSYISAEADQPFIHNIITRFDSGTNKPLPPPLLLARRHPARVHLHLLRPQSQTSLAKFYEAVTQKITICISWCPDRIAAKPTAMFFGALRYCVAVATAVTSQNAKRHPVSKMAV